MAPAQAAERFGVSVTRCPYRDQPGATRDGLRTIVVARSRSIDFMAERSRPRGRPRAGHPDAISDAALGLMAEHGWEATTMHRIAAHAGISSPTLFRYFPTKADVLWHGINDNADLFRSAFRERRDHGQLSDAVVDSYLEMLVADADRLRRVKRRLAVLTRDSAAAEASWAQFTQWNELVTDLVADGRGETADTQASRVIGAMFWSALWSSLKMWAVSDEPDPTSFIRAAQQYMHSPEG